MYLSWQLVKLYKTQYFKYECVIPTKNSNTTIFIIFVTNYFHIYILYP